MDTRPAVKEPSWDKYQASWSAARVAIPAREYLYSARLHRATFHIQEKWDGKLGRLIHQRQRPSPARSSVGRGCTVCCCPSHASGLVVLPPCAGRAHGSRVTWAQQGTIPTVGSKSHRKKLKSNSAESGWIMKSLFSLHILFKVFKKERGRAKL